MKHTRFLSDNQPVCENPARLDDYDSPVIIDLGVTDEQICTDCNAALMTHNKKAFEDELSYEYNKRLHMQEDPLSAVRGITYGVLIGSVLWLIVGMIVWLVFFNG